MNYVIGTFTVIGACVATLGVFFIFCNLAELGYERWLAYRGYTEEFRAFLSDRISKRKRR